MPRLTWLGLVLILLVIIAPSYLVQALLHFLSGFSNIILILILAGLVAYALEPLIEGLQGISFPTWHRAAGEGIVAGRAEERVNAWHPSRPMSVTFVYLSLVILVIVVVAVFIPATVAQVNEIAPRLNSMARSGGAAKCHSGVFGSLEHHCGFRIARQVYDQWAASVCDADAPKHS